MEESPMRSADTDRVRNEIESSPPRLISPVDNARVESDLVTFSWEEVPEVKAYWIQVAADPDFNELVFDSHIAPSTSLTLRGRIPVDKSQLYWRMRGRDASGWGPYGDVATFTVSPRAQSRPAAPSPRQQDIPVPASPTNGAPVDGSAVSFVWNAVPQATQYYLQVASDRGFTNLLFDAPAGDALTLTLFDVLPEDGTELYWRVRAGNKKDWWAWSTPASFRATTNMEAEVHKRIEEEERTRRRKEVTMHIKEVPDEVTESRTTMSQAAITIGIMLLSFIITLVVIFILALNM